MDEKHYKCALAGKDRKVSQSESKSNIIERADPLAACYREISS